MLWKLNCGNVLQITQAQQISTQSVSDHLDISQWQFYIKFFFFYL